MCKVLNVYKYQDKNLFGMSKAGIFSSYINKINTYVIGYSE